MIKNIKNLIASNFTIKILPLFFFSCVYYNTFYNAEVNYEKAEKIIQETSSPNSDDDKIPAQAKKLLGKAIENSNIVINKYPDSKYVDDAYFIIGRASFLRREFFNAEKYLKKINDYYPDSEYCDESKIWLAYTYLKMDSLDVAKRELNALKNIKQDKSQFLVNNILAEISIKEDSPFNAYDYYNKSLRHTNKKSEKTSIYLKLLDISKRYEHIDSSIVYLGQLSEYGTDAMKKEVKLDWIKFNRQAGNFSDLLIEIDRLLNQSEFSSIYIKLELEKAKIYLDQKDFESAKIFFTDLSDKYSRKSESAEALYQLGYIALMENFDLELALEYFEKSKKDRKTSLYGKRSRDMINRINDYKNLLQELEVILSKDELDSQVSREEEVSSNKNSMTKQFMPKPNSKDVTPDSIIFVISETLLFDFDQLDNAKNSYKRLIDEYPDSKFRPQSIYVLDYYFPDEDWKDMLQEEYPNSKFNSDGIEGSDSNNDNSYSIKDGIWDMCEVSYNLCSEKFLDLYIESNDLDALYFYAFIADGYLNDTQKAIKYYKEYLSSDSNLRYYSEATSRLNQIEDNVYSMIELTHQKIDYYNSIEALRNGEQIDSVLAKVDKCIQGGFSAYKSSGQLIKTKLNKLMSINSQISTTSKSDSLSTDLLDSLYFVIGKIYQLDFTMNDSASHYYRRIANNFPDSRFRHESIILLNSIDFNNRSSWATILEDEYSDSICVIDSSYKTINIIEDVNDSSFIDVEIAKLELLNSFSDLFKIDSILVSDTTNINIDSLNNKVKNAQ